MWVREGIRAVFSTDRNENSNAKPMLKPSGAGAPNMPTACGGTTPSPAYASESLSLISGTTRTRSQQTRTVTGEHRSPTSSAGGGKHIDDEEERFNDVFVRQEGTVEGLVGSEDVELGWLRHGFFVWCGEPPRLREWEMLSSTGVITEDEIITYVVLGRVSNAISVLLGFSAVSFQMFVHRRRADRGYS